MGPKQVFEIVGYQFNLKEGKVRPTPECWQAFNAEFQKLLSRPTCLVRQLMSLDRVTKSHKEASPPRLNPHVALEKQMEGTGERIHQKRSIHPHLKRGLPDENVLKGQPLHLFSHALQIFTNASKERWGPQGNTLQGKPSPFQKANYI